MNPEKVIEAIEGCLQACKEQNRRRRENGFAPVPETEQLIEALQIVLNTYLDSLVSN